MNYTDSLNSKEVNLNFEDTEIAFRSKTDGELRASYFLFKIINSTFLARVGPVITNLALSIGLPITGLIKKTIFKQFCGGETIEESESVVASLWQGKVGSILDYSVEGQQSEVNFNATAAEIVKIVMRASGDERIPFAVFKLSGIARFGLLEKISAGTNLSSAEEAEYFRVKGRVNNICKTAFDLDVPVMIDAEESWIQKAIDTLAFQTMQLYNLEKAIVYNTYQLYLTYGLDTLKEQLRQAEEYGFFLGAKLVRGAYMEKERARAAEMNYVSVIQPDKKASDDDYDAALVFCMDNLEKLAFVAGTHNEGSCRKLVELMRAKSVSSNNEHVYFSQLLGMSDNLSFNLAEAGFNVVKYVPYGPVKAVLPYLFRRAEENSAIAGQMSRQLRLIREERMRRNSTK